MLKNYFKTALRFLIKTKWTTLVNIMGLALGLTCATLIFLFVQYELSVDLFHQKIDRLYSLILVGESKDISHAMEYRLDIDYRVAPILSHDYPEVQKVARITPWSGKIYHKNQGILEHRFWFADPNIFDLLTLPLQRGDAKTALQTPNSVVITSAMAHKYFGEEDPIGKTLEMMYHWYPVTYRFTVTGILKDLPKTSSLKIDFIAYVPFERIQEDRKRVSGEPNATVEVMVFMELSGFSSYESLRGKLNDLHVQENYKFLNLDNMRYDLQPFKGAYIESGATFFEPDSSPDMEEASMRKSDIRLLVTLTVLGGIVLIISCINIVNLATARAGLRAGEIGVRKVMGAKKRQLVFQFISETILLSYLSLLFALLLAELFLPSFNTLIKRELSINYITNYKFLAGMFGVGTLTGFVSGVYPAFVLSSLKPATALKSHRLKSSAYIRKGLMVLQIGVCVVVILFSLVMLEEAGSLKALDPGFKSDNLVFFHLGAPDLARRYLSFKNELLRIPGVTHVTASNFVPWREGFMLSFSYYNQNVAVRSRVLSIDSSFMETYQIPLADGKGFRTELVENTGWIIVNETARTLLESSGNAILSKFIGTSSASYWRHRVKGVMKDFYCFYPSRPIPPLVLLPTKYLRMGREFITIRLSEGNHEESLAQVEKAVKRVFPKSFFDYKYVAEEMEKMHGQKMGYRWLALVFVTGFSLFIAAIGLFGFATYECQRCIKEIGIRKALGAKPGQIVLHFIFRFIRITLVANILAWPVCHFAIQQILKFTDYPHPIRIRLADFALAGLLTLVLTIATVGFQTYRAALVDPVKALRYE